MLLNWLTMPTDRLADWFLIQKKSLHESWLVSYRSTEAKKFLDCDINHLRWATTLISYIFLVFSPLEFYGLFFFFFIIFLLSQRCCITIHSLHVHSLHCESHTQTVTLWLDCEFCPHVRFECDLWLFMRMLCLCVLHTPQVLSIKSWLAADFWVKFYFKV